MISCVVSAPVDTYSGYGKRSVDFIKELIKNSDWSVKILSQRWGNTRMGYLEDHGESDLISRIIPNLKEKPDVWIQITVPNEFQPVGKFNIGVTAGVETTLCDVSWINGCNRMDLVVASSELGKQSMYSPIYRDQTGREIKAETPCEVLFEGIDTSRYFSNPKRTEVLQDLKNSWNFLVVGHWLQGNVGEDRKNIPMTIRYFLEAFKDRGERAPGLVIKTSRCIASELDKEDILTRICEIRDSVQYKKSLPNVYLLHGDLTDAEMNEVYNDPRIMAMVTFTKGEGFGRPLVEFVTTGKPIIASAWSGYRDVLLESNSMFIGGTIKQVHPSAVQDRIILPQASWFTVDPQQAIAGLKDVYINYGRWRAAAEKEKQYVLTNFTLDHMGEKIKNLIVQRAERALQEMPKEPEFIKIS